jgi:hypothetical protein
MACYSLRQYILEASIRPCITVKDNLMESINDKS